VSLNEIIESTKNKYDFSIFSKCVGKSKPASLFFISKFGCLIDSVIFYNNNNLQKKLSNYDVIITSNPELIKLYPEKCIKFKTSYNKDVIANCEIDTIKDLIKKIEKIKYVDLI
jgi:thiamine pyrophosphokinase